MDIEKLLTFVDHTLLSQTATPQQILRACDEGLRYNTASVCIPPCYVRLAKEHCGKRLCGLHRYRVPERQQQQRRQAVRGAGRTAKRSGRAGYGHKPRSCEIG